MDKPWYRKFFPSRPDQDLQQTKAKADQGDAEAQFGLGLRYSCGELPLQDYTQAAFWYRRAADQNHALAQYNLAMMYEEGQGVPRSDTEAARWIRKAAEQGDAAAQFNLGLRCQREGSLSSLCPQVEVKIEAYKWFRLAADQGYLGSAMAFERQNLSMSGEEVAEGDQRAAAFTTRPTPLAL